MSERAYHTPTPGLYDIIATHGRPTTIYGHYDKWRDYGVVYLSQLLGKIALTTNVMDECASVAE